MAKFFLFGGSELNADIVNLRYYKILEPSSHQRDTQQGGNTEHHLSRLAVPKLRWPDRQGTTMLGKRKREVAVVARPRYGDLENEPPSSSPIDVGADIFRKYFESNFEPLPEQEKTATPSLLEDEDEEADEDEDDDLDMLEEDLPWEGLSDAGEDTAPVEVIEHRVVADIAEDIDISRPRYKTFMVRKSCALRSREQC